MRGSCWSGEICTRTFQAWTTGFPQLGKGSPGFKAGWTTGEPLSRMRNVYPVPVKRALAPRARKRAEEASKCGPIVPVWGCGPSSAEQAQAWATFLEPARRASGLAQRVAMPARPALRPEQRVVMRARPALPPAQRVAMRARLALPPEQKVSTPGQLASGAGWQAAKRVLPASRRQLSAFARQPASCRAHRKRAASHPVNGRTAARRDRSRGAAQ